MESVRKCKMRYEKDEERRYVWKMLGWREGEMYVVCRTIRNEGS